MKLGFNLPQIGTAVGPDAIVKVAKRAEELNYDSLWVTDRLLVAVNPQTGYAGTPGAPIPAPYQTALDPLEALTFAAAVTSRIRLGTSVLVTGLYNPVILARSLTTLDVLSKGRLIVGLGQGWSKDEFDAAGASMQGRGDVADEFLEVLHAIWETDPSEYSGKHFTLPKSIINPKPIQKPHPPIYLAAFSPGAMQRVAKLADGWNPTGLPPAAVPQMLAGIKQMAQQAGRNPDEIKVIYRANVDISPEARGDDRAPFTGSIEQVKSDIAGAAQFGIDELFIDPTFSTYGTTADGFVDLMEKLKS